MKVCKKCKYEYKDEYIYCPNCGKPYDNNVKSPIIGSGASEIVKKIVDIILYVLGGMMIIGSIPIIPSNVIQAIVGILIGLSLFSIFYKLLEDNTNINESYIKIARIVIPILLLFALGLTASDTQTAINNPSKSDNVNEIIQN